MTRLLYFLFLICPFALRAQTGDMRVYTVAGSLVPTGLLGDGVPATSAMLAGTEGVWLDGNCNVYFTTGSIIRKVDAATGLISTVAGTSSGFAGDNLPATNAKLKPYGLYVDIVGNIFIADAGNNRIRKVNATTGIITTIAGGGSSIGDGGQATNAQLNDPPTIYVDNIGNLYIGETARIRKVNTSGVITTIAGTGVAGLSGDGGPATAAKVYGVSGILLDQSRNLFFADRGNSRIRKINTSGIITTIAGTTDGFSGDGGLATAAQLSGAISFVIDYFGNIVVGDNQNDRIRKIDAITSVITTIAGVGPTGSGSKTEGALATEADIHPEFMFLDRTGNIYYSCFCGQIRKVTNYFSGSEINSSYCNETGIATNTYNTFESIKIYPNPIVDKLIILTSHTSTFLELKNSIGQTLIHRKANFPKTELDLRELLDGIYYLSVKSDLNCRIEKIQKITH